MKKRTEKAIDRRTRYKTVLVDFPEKGNVVTIAKEYGRPIGGKRVRIAKVYKAVNVERGWVMDLVGHEGQFSINWIQSRYNKLVL